MKTQILSIAIFVLSLTVLNSYGASNEAENVPDNVEVSEMSLEITSNVEETDLELENWMTSDNYWNLSEDLNTPVDEELTIEPWMTNEDLWSNNTKQKNEVYSVGGANYTIIKIKKYKEEPLVIRRWIVDDNYWSL
jgi:hypothetical protein